MPFNEILARERKARGLSQEELASRIQVSRQAVSKWETGDAMPDLNKLLALADALDISLDTLSGRETPPVPAVSKPAPIANKQPRMLWFFCALLVGVLAAAGLWGWSQKDVAPAEEAPAASALTTMSEEFTVSGVGFHGQSDSRVAYQFTPSISGEQFTYQITFAGSDGRAFTFDAPCSGGVCSGVADLEDGYGSHTVTVSVTDGSVSRNLAIAMNLSFQSTAPVGRLW